MSIALRFYLHSTKIRSWVPDLPTEGHQMGNEQTECWRGYDLEFLKHRRQTVESWEVQTDFLVAEGWVICINKSL